MVETASSPPPVRSVHLDALTLASLDKGFSDVSTRLSDDVHLDDGVRFD
jgi:hypothetical protein